MFVLVTDREWFKSGQIPTFPGMGDDNDIRKCFGRRLADLRKRVGWSQETLALQSGLARSYLGGVERGSRNLSLVAIARLADTLGLKAFHLLDFDGELGITRPQAPLSKDAGPPPSAKQN